jgi:hypothetical protein
LSVKVVVKVPMIETLKTIPLFKDLTGEQLDAVAARLLYVSYAKGDVVFSGREKWATGCTW